MTFGQKLKELRTAKGWTQSDLAKKANAARESIARLETGNYEPSWATVQSLAKALDVDCREFQEAPTSNKKAPKKGQQP